MRSVSVWCKTCRREGNNTMSTQFSLHRKFPKYSNTNNYYNGSTYFPGTGLGSLCTFLIWISNQASKLNLFHYHFMTKGSDVERLRNLLMIGCESTENGYWGFGSDCSKFHALTIFICFLCSFKPKCCVPIWISIMIAATILVILLISLDV